jgi:hypothetical protein
MDALVPTILVASSLPMFAIAWRVGRGDLQWLGGLDSRQLREPRRLATRASRLLGLAGLAVLLGGPGLYWADNDEGRIALVVLLMLFAVNGLAIALVLAVRAAGRDDHGGDGGK